MAIGYALYENMPLKPDNRWVDSFAEYLLPTSADLPASFETVILEIPEASGPFGAKGIGEITTALAAPAIANAVVPGVRAAGRVAAHPPRGGRPTRTLIPGKFMTNLHEFRASHGIIRQNGVYSTGSLQRGGYPGDQPIPCAAWRAGTSPPADR